MTLAVADAEAILRSRLGEPTKTQTDYMVGVTTPSGKVLAMHSAADKLMGRLVKKRPDQEGKWLNG
jgi:hypothetical protein